LARFLADAAVQVAVERGELFSLFGYARFGLEPLLLCFALQRANGMKLVSPCRLLSRSHG
jgi:hypothetical protein